MTRTKPLPWVAREKVDPSPNEWRAMREAMGMTQAATAEKERE